MNVLVIEPGQAPYTLDIENSLEQLQALTGKNGIQHCEAIYPFNDAAVCIINEEAKLYPEAFLPNRALLDEYGRVQDVILGTMVIAGISEIDGDLTSLTTEQIDKYSEQYQYANEFYIKNDGSIGFNEVEPESLEQEETIEVGG